MSDPGLRLERPALELRAAFLAAVADYERAGERDKLELYHPAVEDFAGYCELLRERSRGNRLPEGWVPESTFWMIDGMERIAGIIRIRHRLTDFLEERGGHIGYDVPPSRRGRGNGRSLLALGLVEAARLGLARVLLACDDDNVASIRIIERCGGVWHDVRQLPGMGVPTRRYWLELPGTPELAIRDEAPADAAAIRAVHSAAFETEAEARLVDALRDAGRLTLSLIAVDGAAVVGHIAFSPVSVDGGGGRIAAGIGLGPVAVVPERQRSGIGSRLVAAGLGRLRAAGHRFCIVLGHADYYPRFGFQRASRFGIRWEHDAPDDAFLAVELAPGGLAGVSGVVRYAPEFASV